jgi:hypothetical protein
MLSGWNQEGSPVLLIETGARTGSCVAKEWPIFYLTNEYDGEIMSRTLFGLSWTSSDTLLAKGVMFFQGFWLTLR